jgi:hypothetical protein
MALVEPDCLRPPGSVVASQAGGCTVVAEPGLPPPDDKAFSPDWRKGGGAADNAAEGTSTSDVPDDIAEMGLDATVAGHPRTRRDEVGATGAPRLRI